MPTADRSREIAEAKARGEPHINPNDSGEPLSEQPLPIQRNANDYWLTDKDHFILFEEFFGECRKTWPDIDFETVVDTYVDRLAIDNYGRENVRHLLYTK